MNLLVEPVYSQEHLVSVVVPSFNHAPFIANTIRSIWSQTYSRIEIIVIDDCSVDESVFILSELQRESVIPMTIVSKEVNRGICDSLNVGIGMARGKYISFLASDDLYPPTRVFEHVKILEAISNSAVAGCCGPLEMIDISGVSTGRRKAIPAKSAVSQLDVIKRKAGYSLQGSTFYTKIAKKIMFDERLYFEDWDFFIRLFRFYRIIPLDSVSCLYRVHEGGANRNVAKMVEGRSQILSKYQNCRYLHDPSFLHCLRQSIFLANSQSYFNVAQYTLSWNWMAKLLREYPLSLLLCPRYVAALIKRSLISLLFG